MKMDFNKILTSNLDLSIAIKINVILTDNLVIKKEQSEKLFKWSLSGEICRKNTDKNIR